MFSFHTSPLITARMRITLKYTFAGAMAWVAEPGLGMNDTGDLYNEVVTVKDATVFKMIVPYLAHQSWTPCYGVNNGTATTDDGYLPYYTFPYLSLTCDNLVKGAGATSASVFVAVIISAAEDFEFRQLISVTPDQTHAVLTEEKGKSKENTGILRSYEPQMDINREFSEAFRNPFGRDFAPDPYAHGTDRVKTIEHCLGRFDYGGLVTTVSPGVSIQTDYGVLPAVSTGSTKITNGKYISSLFRWRRGSMRVKSTMSVSTSSPGGDDIYWFRNNSPYPPITDPAPAYDFEVANGSVPVKPSLWSNAEVEAPFYYPFAAAPTSYYGSLGLLPSQTGISFEPSLAADTAVTALKYYLAAGSDFQLFYLMPVPALNRWPR